MRKLGKNPRGRVNVVVGKIRKQMKSSKRGGVLVESYKN